MTASAATTKDVIETLGRHVGHSIRCARATTGDAFTTAIVETISLRCDDCGEVILEGQRVLSNKRSRK
jgi:hypothetical protein